MIIKSYNQFITMSRFCTAIIGGLFLCACTPMSVKTKIKEYYERTDTIRTTPTDEYAYSYQVQFHSKILAISGKKWSKCLRFYRATYNRTLTTTTIPKQKRRYTNLKVGIPMFVAGIAIAVFGLIATPPENITKSNDTRAIMMSATGFSLAGIGLVLSSLEIGDSIQIGTRITNLPNIYNSYYKTITRCRERSFQNEPVKVQYALNNTTFSYSLEMPRTGELRHAIPVYRLFKSFHKPPRLSITVQSGRKNEKVFNRSLQSNSVVATYFYSQQRKLLRRAIYLARHLKDVSPLEDFIARWKEGEYVEQANKEKQEITLQIAWTTVNINDIVSLKKYISLCDKIGIVSHSKCDVVKNRLANLLPKPKPQPAQLSQTDGSSSSGNDSDSWIKRRSEELRKQLRYSGKMGAFRQWSDQVGRPLFDVGRHLLGGAISRSQGHSSPNSPRSHYNSPNSRRSHYNYKCIFACASGTFISSYRNIMEQVFSAKNRYHALVHAREYMKRNRNRLNRVCRSYPGYSLLNIKPSPTLRSCKRIY